MRLIGQSVRQSRWFARVRHYAAADDPRVATANMIALALAWNTPFYPFYLLAVGYSGVAPGPWLTLCSFPVFLIAPIATRYHSLFGRVYLALTCIANTLFCTWLLGEASGTALFLLPCIALAGLLFRQEERGALFSFLLLPIIAGISLAGRYPPSPFACGGDACSGILWMDSFSVAMLMAFFSYLTTGLDRSARV